ncbi:hypothetical protein [Streptomyces sp. NPDC101455]|uniref:hypothetical protein n=1 Tax=Streptomyces sp. NPDC101455 TaxID=3366142 RepID=UPI0037FBF5CA
MFVADTNPLPGWRGGDGNAAYLDKTLKFGEIETQLNESTHFGFLMGLMLQGLLVSFLFYMVCAVIGLFLLVVAGVVGLLWFVVSGFLSVALFWVVLLFARVPEPIAEWRVLLAERYGRRDSVYHGIRQVLHTRGYPVRVEEQEGRMILRENTYSVYISVFAYGSSLYLGWMMWRSRRGYQFIGQYLRDMLQGIQGRNQIEWQMLRSERARALREAAHIACREGLAVALSDTTPPTLPAQVTGPQPSYGSGIPGPVQGAYGVPGTGMPGAAPQMPTTPPQGPYDGGTRGGPGWQG